jgi:hypothetical protein
MLGIIDALMSMSLDIYKQLDTQDPDTGVIKKEFLYYKTIPCHARGIISQSSTRNLDKQTFNNKYSNEQYIEVRTAEKLTTREKISNICDSSGNPVWFELNYPQDTPTIFEVIGTTPITDPFGNVVGYNSSLKRSENQQIGL